MAHLHPLRAVSLQVVDGCRIAVFTHDGDRAVKVDHATYFGVNIWVEIVFTFREKAGVNGSVTARRIAR